MPEKTRYLTVAMVAEKLLELKSHDIVSLDENRYKSAILVNGMLSKLDVSDARELPRAAILGRLLHSVLDYNLGLFVETECSDNNLTDLSVGDLVDDEMINFLGLRPSEEFNSLQIDFGEE